MEKHSHKEENNMEHSNRIKTKTDQTQKEQKSEKSFYAQNPEFADSILEKLQFDELELSESQQIEIENFIQANTISRKATRRPFPFAAAIHLGFLLVTVAVAFFIDNSSTSQLFVSFSIIFAAMAALFLNNQNQNNHE